MLNTKFRVVFDGPDADGLFSARVGQYIKYTATHTDDGMKEHMIAAANERANLIMEEPDHYFTQGSGGECVSIKRVKEDLAACIDAETPNVELRGAEQASLAERPSRTKG